MSETPSQLYPITTARPGGNIRRLLPWLCEVSLLLWTASILFLPWFEGYPSQPHMPGPRFYANDLFTRGYESIPIAYGLILVAYGCARFLKRNWLALLPLIPALLLFSFHQFIGFLGDSYVPGLHTASMLEQALGYPRGMIGLDINLWAVGLFAIGLCATATGRGRWTILLGGVGAVLGFLSLLFPLSLLLLLLFKPGPAVVTALVFILPLMGAAAGLQLAKTPVKPISETPHG